MVTILKLQKRTFQYKTKQELQFLGTLSKNKLRAQYKNYLLQTAQLSTL